MSKRRRLPAPPLVLTPYFARYSVGSSREALLVELARFLQSKNLLTDGGVKSLEQGLRGRNLVVSLGLQDVRSYAHGLVQVLTTRPADQWATCFHDYFQAYDKGKPRRPTHLQRLYLEWSPDSSWPGLLQACRDHPRLWPELSVALDRLDDDSIEKDMLSLALRCSDTVEPWTSAFSSEKSAQKELLVLLPLLTPDKLPWRLSWLSELASSCSGNEDWHASVITACHCDFPQARRLRRHTFNPEPLERLGLACLNQDQIDPLFVSAFRSFVRSSETIEKLFNAIPEDDPLRGVVFGARPGSSWLEAQRREMYDLIELQ
jgi:hypothetical protein